MCSKHPVFLFIVLLSLFTTVLKSQTERDEDADQPKREISWLNPDIKVMEGLKHHILNSETMGHKVGYVVWIPPAYAEERDRRFPVIFFLHGAGGNESADAAGFSEWVLKSMNAGVIEPVICVFPNGGLSGYRDEVEQMIITELIPVIDLDYRTLPESHARALAGFSMGGAGSVYLSITHPELFTAAGSMGGGIRNSDQLSGQIKESIPVWRDQDFGFILINGDEDRPEAFANFAEVLDQNSIDYEVIVLANTHHNLGLYYERSAEKLIAYLGEKLAAR